MTIDNPLITPEHFSKLDLALDATTKYMFSCKPFFDEVGKSGMAGALYIEIYGKAFHYFMNTEIPNEADSKGNSVGDKPREPHLLLG